MNNTTQLTSKYTLDKIIKQTFFNHKGFIVERMVEGFKILGKQCLTMSEVDLIIDNALGALKNSLK